MFEENTKQVNRVVMRLFTNFTPAILIMVFLSYVGVFEFGKTYTNIVLVAGLTLGISPRLLIHHLSDSAFKHYVLIALAVFIGVLGTTSKIGIYITFILAPLFSCLYFEPKLVLRTSALSYGIMVIAMYYNTATRAEVLYGGRDFESIFMAYITGFTLEYIITTSLLYFLVQRARLMMEQRNTAEEANRMKSQFLSTMSHEIRTPMNAIIGMADVALRREMDDELRKEIGIIKSSSAGLLEIINDILDLSRVEAGKINIIASSYSTATLAEEMSAIVDARNTPQKVPIHYHIQPDMPACLNGDAMRLRQVMLNFASNAIKYTDFGSIEITMRCEPVDPDTVNLIYSVKDTGQGIREEDQAKLFTLYTQFDAQRNHGKESAGIGLAISKAFIDSMGGTITVQSRYGVGSTFTFSVPQRIVSAPELSAAVRPGSADGEAFTAEGARVLLVDDNAINREVLKALLEPLKLTIDEAADGQQAVFRAASRPFDLILMDSHMPVMNGEEAARAIRNTDGINQGVPIVAVTADAIAGVRERLLASGMNDCITKPIDPAALNAAVRRYLPAEKIHAVS